jgi:VWFA-related protein
MERSPAVPKSNELSTTGVRWCMSVSIQGGKRATFAVSTQLVEVPVIVFDEKGALATNLGKEDFRLVDDGVVQQIQHLDSVRTPVSFVMVADLSSSMTRKIPFVQQAALSLLDPQNDQDAFYDEFAFVGIGNRARELLPFTRDHDELKQRLPLLLTASNEATALFDGIYFSVTKERREAANQRRAIIIISDGGDNHSLYNLRETRDLLEESDVPVFAVMAGPTFELPAILPRPKKQDKRPGIVPVPGFPNLPIEPEDDFIGPAERQGPHNLSSLTEVTGGGAFTAKN